MDDIDLKTAISTRNTTEMSMDDIDYGFPLFSKPLPTDDSDFYLEDAIRHLDGIKRKSPMPLLSELYIGEYRDLYPLSPTTPGSPSKLLDFEHSIVSNRLCRSLDQCNDDIFLLPHNEFPGDNVLTRLSFTENEQIPDSNYPNLAKQVKRIGVYSPKKRRERILKYLEKRKRRVFHKQIKYDCRKRLAATCPRVKGRFVKRNSQSSSSLEIPNEFSKK